MHFVFRIEPIGLYGHEWHVSAKSRNKFMHVFNGNGSSRAAKGSGKSKNKSKEQRSPEGVASSSQQPASSVGGKGPEVSDAYLEGVRMAMGSIQHSDQSEERLEAERLLREQIRSSLPVHLVSPSPQLVQEEWNAQVVSSQSLSAMGGVAVVPKKEIPEVLRRVGQTSRATAIVTTQPASDLYMPGAPCKEVFCSILVASDSGLAKVAVKRFLIQLGVNPECQVEMDTEGLDTIQESLTMHKVVIRFDARGGWDSKMMRPVIVSDYLKLHMPETAFSTITVREDGSSTALVHSSKVSDLLKKSGKSHVYSKPHVSVKAWQGMEILWLPSTVLHAEALKLAKEDGATLGLAVKQNQESVRFGLRFHTLTAMQTRAVALNLTQEASLGRFKITAVSESAGTAGVLDMMASISWAIEDVLYIGDGHAIVAAKDCPNKNKYKLMRQDGLAVPLWIHAVNSKARELFKAKSINFRSADTEGEDVDMGQPEPQVGNVQTRIQQAAEVASKRSKELQSLRRPREPTLRTPSRENRQRTDGGGGGAGGGQPAS